MKQALCICRASAPEAVRQITNDALLIPIDPTFYDTTTQLHDRAYCETDESLLQLLPYIVVYQGEEIFMYRRGKGGGELRLHDQLSIGVGGHVDSETDLYKDNKPMLLKHLQDEASREIEEELGAGNQLSNN